MQFIDRAEIEVEGGKGGDGIVAFRREKYVPAGGPAGGNGGKGGSVIFVATQNLQTLLDFQYSRYFKADDGKVPCGTVVYDLDSEEIIGDLVTPEQTLIVAAGGKGGLGNRHFLSNNNRAPEYALPGLDGAKRHLRLELKLLAEVGIIGLPNAGKSTLISAVSSARPKIADYPFTTLIPNLGVVRKPTGDGTVFADIPGLIEGAHLGIGLGHEFLRHIERTRLLIHLVSLTAEDPIADYQIIQGELAAYGRGLEKRSQILVFNKIDAVDEETIDNYQKQFAKITNAEILTISAVTGAGLTTLLAKVWQQLEQLERVEDETPSLFS
jgi:GTP-binding protein